MMRIFHNFPLAGPLIFVVKKSVQFNQRAVGKNHTLLRLALPLRQANFGAIAQQLDHATTWGAGVWN